MDHVIINWDVKPYFSPRWPLRLRRQTPSCIVSMLDVIWHRLSTQPQLVWARPVRGGTIAASYLSEVTVHRCGCFNRKHGVQIFFPRRSTITIVPRTPLIRSIPGPFLTNCMIKSHRRSGHAWKVTVKSRWIGTRWQGSRKERATWPSSEIKQICSRTVLSLHKEPNLCDGFLKPKMSFCKIVTLDLIDAVF